MAKAKKTKPRDHPFRWRATLIKGTLGAGIEARFADDRGANRPVHASTDGCGCRVRGGADFNAYQGCLAAAKARGKKLNSAAFVV
jgi:hypothetical protein